MKNANTPTNRAIGYLKPSETLSELFAGLIISLTFTLAASTLGGGSESGIRAAFLGAIGANIAWGLIDAVLYLMNGTFERKRHFRFARMIAESDPAAGLEKIGSELDPILGSVTSTEDRDRLYRSIYKAVSNGTPPVGHGLAGRDIAGALQIFCTALLATLPVIVPLVLGQYSMPALRISNFAVIALLFVVGYRWAGYAQTNRWLTGLGLMSVGLALVAIAIPLGG